MLEVRFDKNPKNRMPIPPNSRTARRQQACVLCFEIRAANSTFCDRHLQLSLASAALNKVKCGLEGCANYIAHQNTNVCKHHLDIKNKLMKSGF